jgi:hypothetical protein
MIVEGSVVAAWVSRCLLHLPSKDGAKKQLVAAIIAFNTLLSSEWFNWEDGDEA